MRPVALHLCSELPNRLRLLDVRLEAAQPALLAGIGKHVKPNAVSLAAPAPFEGMWPRQLEHLAVTVRDDAEAAALARIVSGYYEEGRPSLVSLELEDRRLPRPEEPVPFGQLAAGGRLQRLVLRGGSVSHDALQACGRLTSLRICRAHVAVGDGGSVLSALCRLSLERCILSNRAFPEALCRLSSLTSLAVLDCGLRQLHVHFSKLRWGGSSRAASPHRVMHALPYCSCSLLPAASPTTGAPCLPRAARCASWSFQRPSWGRAAWCQLEGLTTLTTLRLPRCGLQWLPEGPHLSGLRW